ncbi:hypothetical protein C8R42DRAFT_648369 [Lentinula raphanica]|nr:hypothetical protein C8R42DRAFT_648369 [Lentinula raphanica]
MYQLYSLNKGEDIRKNILGPESLETPPKSLGFPGFPEILKDFQRFSKQLRQKEEAYNYKLGPPKEDEEGPAEGPSNEGSANEGPADEADEVNKEGPSNKDKEGPVNEEPADDANKDEEGPVKEGPKAKKVEGPVAN